VCIIPARQNVKWKARVDERCKTGSALLLKQTHREKGMVVLQNLQRVSNDLRGRCAFQLENAHDVKRRMFISDHQRALKCSQLTSHLINLKTRLSWPQIWQALIRVQ